MKLSTRTSTIAPQAPKPVARFPEGTLFTVETAEPVRIYYMNTTFLKLIRNGERTYPCRGPLVGRDIRRFTDMIHRFGPGAKIRITHWSVRDEELRRLAEPFGVWSNGVLESVGEPYASASN